MKYCLFFLSFLLFNFLSQAQTIGLDPTFATNGIYLGDTGAYSRVIVQPDKKIVVTGSEKRNGKFENVKRFNVDGTVDIGFADNGFFTLNLPVASFINMASICLQSDGKILLGGGADTVYTDATNPNGDDDNFLMVRLNSDGSLDSSFGGGGYVITPYLPYHPLGNSSDAITGIAIQTDGKIIAAGDSNVDTIMLVRYHTDGRLDSSFGTYGKVKLIQGFTYPHSNDVAVMSDGRIIVGAETKINALGAYAFTTIRLLPNGSLDTSFNHTGVAYTNTNLPGLLYCKAMRLQQDGKVLLLGYADSIAVVRFDTSGKLDNSFGKNGLVKIAPAGKTAPITIQSDGKILIGGNFDTSFVIYRRLADGSPDNSFGINGKVISNLFVVIGITTQPDNKILACGATPYPNNKTTLVRFTPNATGISMLEMHSQISIYPNPANDYIEIKNTSHHSIQQLSLHSTDGKLLRLQTIPDTNRLPTDGLNEGMYMLQISFNNNYRVTKKIIIQKK